MNALATTRLCDRTSDLIVAKVRVFGDTLGNEDLTSSELSFPITYCDGCLIDYPLSALSPDKNGDLHCGNMLTDLPVAGCRPGQDDKVDCRTCAATNPLCNTPSM